MSLEFDLQASEGYEPSIASTASSSRVSVFSDTFSTQSSIATSISDDFRSSQDDAREQDRICAQAQRRLEEVSALQTLLQAGGPCPSYADVTSVPAPQRHHPRRCSLSRHQKPPPLVRQRDRRINFVDNLVDSATQMVEVIWPLAVVPCRSEGSGRGVLPLRTYIEETLRRSRTSYSTLQVALYYLILIRPHVPKTDFTMEQTVDCPADRALMCGRRMFLAALILASKYLQDRNYSAKAWSKMSGLKVCEINTNERVFLAKIGWKLHISKPTFERWQEVVLKYTPNPPQSPSLEAPYSTSMWKRLVPSLTPELDNLPGAESLLDVQCDVSEGYGFPSPTTPTPTQHLFKSVHSLNGSQESTPTPTAPLPRFLEPNPDVQPPTPALARLGPLPTPLLTPSSIASSTPAASVYGSRRPSISSAWALADRSIMNRCTMDAFDSRPPLSRRPSMMSVTSRGSSPESMISDHSRSSRSSSISSVSAVSATSSSAPQRACLARQATCRNAGLPPLKLVREEKEGSAAQPIVIDDVEMTVSPDMADFSISEKVLHTPHRHSRATRPVAQITSHSSAEKSRKRGRAHGQRRSALQEELRYLLEESLEDDMDMEEDEYTTSPSSAAAYASSMLARSESVQSMKEAQPPSTHSRRESIWVPVQKNDGRKRTCCSARATSFSPMPLYGAAA